MALFIHHQLLDRPRTPSPTDAQRGSLLGPGFSDDEIERFLRTQGAVYTRYDSDDELCEAVA